MCSRRRWCPGSTTCGLSRRLWPPASPDELHLLDVEAELVEAAQALVDAVGLVGPEDVLARQLRPQRLVAARHLGGRLDRIEARGQADLRRLEVEQLAGHVLLGDLQVVRALPGAQLRVQLARLGIDEVGRERAGVAPEERVRERAVAPEEAREVDAHEQLGERVEQAVAQIGDARPAEQAAIRQREVEVPRDQHGLGLVPVLGPALLVTTPTASTTGTTASASARSSRYSCRAIARRQRLERIERLAVAHEAHDVAVDAARHLDDALALPLGERLAPGQVEEVGVARAHEHLEARRLAHATLPLAAWESSRRR